MARLYLTLLISATLFCTSLCVIASSPSADRIFPDSTKGFFSFRNIEEFTKQWEQTQFGQLMNDPLMDNFKQEVQRELTERMESTFGLTLDAISTLPSGEVAFGMVAIPNQVPGYVLTMDVTGNRPEAQRYIAHLTQNLVAAGARRQTGAYRGLQITVLTFPPPQTPIVQRPHRERVAVEPIARMAYYVFVRDLFIASDQAHLLQLMVDRIVSQAGRSLADVEGYRVTMRRCLADMPAGILPSIRWYVEPLDYGEAVRVLFRGPVAQTRRESPSIFSVLKRQGFDAIQGIGGTVSITTEDQELVYRTFVYANRPYRLAMQMFNFPESTVFTPLPWVPSDLARFTMFYVDPHAVFDNFGGLFDAFVMPGEEGVWRDVLAGLERDPQGPRINVQRELIAHLGNRLIGISHYEKPISAQSESIVVAAELKPGHEAAMLAGIEKLFNSDPDFRGTRHNSHVIWHRAPVAQNTAPRIDDDEDRPPFFPDAGVVVARGHFFFATNVSYLKVVLDRLDAPERAAQSTIGNEEAYKRVNQIFAEMGLTNKPRFFQFFARTCETVRPVYETIRQGNMPQSQMLLGKALNEMFLPEEGADIRRQIIDGSTMPEFDKIQHYFGEAGMYGISEENGFFIKGFIVERNAE